MTRDKAFEALRQVAYNFHDKKLSKDRTTKTLGLQGFCICGMSTIALNSVLCDILYGLKNGFDDEFQNESGGV